MTLCVRHSLRHYSNKRALYAPSDSLSLSNVCFDQFFRFLRLMAEASRPAAEVE